MSKKQKNRVEEKKILLTNYNVFKITIIWWLRKLILKLGQSMECNDILLNEKIVEFQMAKLLNHKAVNGNMKGIDAWTEIDKPGEYKDYDKDKDCINGKTISSTQAGWNIGRDVEYNEYFLAVKEDGDIIEIYSINKETLLNHFKDTKSGWLYHNEKNKDKVKLEYKK